MFVPPEREPSRSASSWLTARANTAGVWRLSREIPSCRVSLIVKESGDDLNAALVAVQADPAKQDAVWWCWLFRPSERRSP